MEYYSMKANTDSARSDSKAIIEDFLWDSSFNFSPNCVTVVHTAHSQTRQSQFTDHFPKCFFKQPLSCFDSWTAFYKLNGKLKSEKISYFLDWFKRYLLRVVDCKWVGFAQWWSSIRDLPWSATKGATLSSCFLETCLNILFPYILI